MDFPVRRVLPYVWAYPGNFGALPATWQSPARLAVVRQIGFAAALGLRLGYVDDPVYVRDLAEHAARASGGHAWSPLLHAQAPSAALVLHDGAKVFASICARLLWIEGDLASSLARWPEAPDLRGLDLGALEDRHVVWLGALWRDPAVQGHRIGDALTSAMALDALLRWRWGLILGVRKRQGLDALDLAPFRRLEAPLRAVGAGDADYALLAATRRAVRAQFGIPDEAESDLREPPGLAGGGRRAEKQP